MRYFRIHCTALIFTLALAVGFAVYTSVQPAFAQETTGGLQGTVKDQSGAVVPRAHVTLTAPRSSAARNL